MANSRVEILSGQLAGSILNNAASESTLQELLAAVKKLDKSFAGGAGGAGGAANSSQGSSGSAGSSQGFGLLGAAASTLSRSFTALGSALGTSVRLLKDNDTALSNWTKGAGAAASQLPLVGKAFGGLITTLSTGIAILEQWNKSLQDATGSGASFGNSILEFRKYAAMTNMDLEQFGRLIRDNSESFAALGGTVTKGAEAFSKISNGLVGPGGVGMNLIHMGMSIEDINEGLGTFLSSTLRGTRITDQNASQVASMYAEYSVHLDKISKLTGESRKQLEEKAKKDAADAAWQLYLSQQDSETRVKMQMQLDTMRAQFGEAGADYVKQMATIGTVTTKETRALQANVHGLGDNTRIMLANAKNRAVSEKEYSNMTEDFTAKTKVATDQMLKRNEHVIYAGQHGVGTIGKILADISLQHIKNRNSTSKLGELTEQEVKERFAAAKAEQSNREFLTSTLRSFSKGITDIYNTIVLGITNSLGKFLSSMGFTSKGLDGVFGNITSMIASGFLSFDNVVEDLTKIFGGTLKTTSAMLGRIFDNLVTVGKDFYEGLSARLVPIIKDASAAISTFINNTFLPTFEKIANIITGTVLPALGNVAAYLFDNLVPAFKNIVYWIEDNVVPVFTRLVDILDTVLGPTIEFLTTNIFKPLGDIIFKDVLPVLGTLADFVFGNLMKGFHFVLDVIENFSTYLELGSLKISEFGQQMVAVYYAIMSKITMGSKYDNLLKQQQASIEENKNRQDQLDKELAAKRDERDRKLAEGQEKRDKERHERQQAAIRKEEKTREEVARGGSAPQAVPARPGESGELGSLAARYESGTKGSEAVGWDSTGGTSYGKYQIATKTGTMDKFLSFLKTNNPEAYERLMTAGPADAGKEGKFAQEWKSLAKEGKLGSSEKDFIKATHYDVGMKGLKNDQLKSMIEQSKALQEVMWSTSVQHGGGGASKIFGKVFKEGMTEEQLIKSIYAERGTRFGSSTEAVQKSVQNRFADEQARALAMVGQKGDASTATAASAPAKQTAVASAAASTQPQTPKTFLQTMEEQRKAALEAQKLAATPTATSRQSTPSGTELAKAAEAKAAEVAAQKTQQTTTASVPTAKETTLNDLLVSLEGLNKQMGLLISVTEDTSAKQVKTTKAALSGNIHGMA
jgi:hypothetical protein